MSLIHQDATIGKDTFVAPNAYIESGVTIGDNCWIGPNVTIFNGATIGNHCKIFPGAVISAIPQDLKFKGEKSFVIIGNNTTIRECVTINRGTAAYGTTTIGENCLLMAYVHVAHDCIIGKHCILSNCVQLAGHVIIDDYVVMGGMSAAHQFTKIGKHAFIAGGTLLRKDVPPYIMAAREPALYTGINAVGLKRTGFNSEDLHIIQDTYRYIYSNGLNTSQAIEKIAEDIELNNHKLTQEIIQFIQSSERGIIKGLNQ